MRLTLMGGWLLSVAVAGLGGYGLARGQDSGPVPDGSRVLEQLEQQQALLVSLRAQVSAMDLRLAALPRSPAPAPAPVLVASAATALAAEAPEGSEQEPEVEEPAGAREEREALVARGEGLVEAALRTGHWRTDDVYALRALLPRMPKEQREAMLSRLITAFNEGRLTPDEQGPLF